jgi:hypothetical protein
MFEEVEEEDAAVIAAEEFGDELDKELVEERAAEKSRKVETVGGDRAEAGLAVDDEG